MITQQESSKKNTRAKGKEPRQQNQVVKRINRRDKKGNQVKPPQKHNKMDNTRVITATPNAGTPYVMAKNNKMLQNKTTNLAHSVPMYPTMNGRQGAQIFMNSGSVLTATKMQFSPPPQRTKSSNDIDLSSIASSIEAFKTQRATYSTITATTTTTFSASCNRAFFAKTNTNSQISPEQLMFEHELMYATNFVNPNSVGVSGGIGVAIGGNHSSKMVQSCDSKFFNPDMSPNHAHEQSSVVGGKTLFNSLKRMVNSLFKPIIDAVGPDHSDSKASTAATASTATTTNHKSMPIPPATYCDKQNCTDSFCLSIDNQQHQQQQQPANMAYSNRECEFFDCDDYIDGGEDTIDFVAASTKFLPHAFGDEFQSASAKDNIYYDCMTKSDSFETPIPTPPPAAAAPASLNPSESDEDSGMENEIDADQLKSDEAISERNADQQQLDQANVQYCENEKVTMTTATGPNKSNQNACRRRQRGKRKNKNHNGNNNNNGNHNNKSSNKYWKKGCAPNKNRHEKQRHEIEMDLHDDLDIETGSFGAEDDFDLEIIDLDVDESSPKTSPNTATATNSIRLTTTTTTPSATPATPVTPATSRPIFNSKTVCIETPIPSPEKLESGCIFTRFFPFKSSTSPSQFFKRFQMPQLANRPPRLCNRYFHRVPVAMRHVSESESDDSFIVFEDISPRVSTAPEAAAATTTATSAAAASSSSQDATYQKRSRQLSECSDDFILFEDGSDDACLRYDTTDEDFYLTDSTDDETDSCSSSDDGE